MNSPKILATVLDFFGSRSRRPSFIIPSHILPSSGPAIGDSEVVPVANPDLKLPKLVSLLFIILGNALFQVSFFIIVSSSSAYAAYLGGTATFSGLVIGIPTLFSGIALVPMTRIDQGRYTRPLNIACASMFLGNILHALAYRAHYLFLILIGRIVSGFGFSFFMYSKRYCSDPRIVGLRRRTTLAGWLVVGQGFGFSVGPFLGGLLYKIGFGNEVFNGFTSPGWIMAVVWAIYWTASIYLFEDVGVPSRSSPPVSSIELTPTSQEEPSATSSLAPISEESEHNFHINKRQWGVIVCMCWYAMTCFFILGAWEANIPVFAAEVFGYSPYRSGNFIALGGIATFPFLLLNVWYARRIQDRVTLALGCGLGLLGLLIMLSILATNKVTFGSFYICWFLVALGFNLASTCTLSLLSKQLPGSWNGRISMFIQYSNYTGRITGAVWGGSGVKVGMMTYVGVQIAIVGIGGLMHSTLWRELKAKTG